MNSDERRHAFKLERLKYILQQIDRLNERFHHYVTVYQTVATALVGAGGGIVFACRQGALDHAGGVILIQTCFWLLVFVGAYASVMVFAGIFSWWDYRKEECEVFKDTVYAGYRKPPKRKAVWRWYEAWFIAFVLISIALACYFTFWVIPPLLVKG